MSLKAALIEVEEALARVPAASDFYSGSWIDAHERRQDELRRLVIDPLRRDRALIVKITPHKTEVALCGIRSSSTGSVSCALTNWCGAARRHLSTHS